MLQQRTATLPGDVGRSTLAIGRPLPRLVRGFGCHVEDETGRVLVDLNNNFTTHIHGNAHPEIARAVAAAARQGASFGAPSLPEFAHADLLVERLAGADQVRYANSGTEAVLLAIRMARALTSRDHIVALAGAYHGSSETAASTSIAESVKRGVPDAVRGLVTTIPVNDIAALEEAILGRHRSVAAILLDLAPNRPGLNPLSPAFIRAASAAARLTGALLIVDEVITFRLAHGGMQSTCDLSADLTVLGKAIGGGLPIGAVAGPKRLMRKLDPYVGGFIESAGTFTGNPISMSAGIAALTLLDEEAITRINALGERLRGRLLAGVSPDRWVVRGIGSLIKLTPVPLRDEDPKRLMQRLWWEAYERSLLITPTATLSISTPMDEQAVDQAAESLLAALWAVDRARPGGGE